MNFRINYILLGTLKYQVQYRVNESNRLVIAV